jgi:alanyl-tRNA synthetase
MGFYVFQLKRRPMAAQRLYEDDPFGDSFTAHVVALGKEGVVLDRTLFHPQGGGQPGDTGTLVWKDGETTVVDAQESGDDVIHVLGPDTTPPPEGTEVTGRIDMVRRRALMRAHTGEHVLFRAIDKVTKGEAAVSKIALEEDGGKLFVEGHDLDWPVIAQSLLQANDAVLSDIAVHTELLPKEKVLGQHPDARIKVERIKGDVARVVVVDGFDAAACSGTHLRSTGEIGAIAITGRNRTGGSTILSFLTGERARSHLIEATCRVGELSELLSADLERLRPTIENLITEKEALWSRYKSASSHLARLKLEHMEPVEMSGLKLYCEVLPLKREEVIKTVNRLIAGQRTVALLASDDEKPFLAFGSSDDAGVDVSPVLRQACSLLGGGGGGKPTFASGGGKSSEHLDDAMELARSLIEEQASS